MYYYGYKHYTLEDPPRCFNVGKGLFGRSESCRSRNHKWHAIVKRHGLRIEVCIGPVTNEEASAWEIENIALVGTFSTNHSHDDPSDIGCNFTKGGDGVSGWRHTSEAKMKMSNSHKGVPLSEKTKQALRVAHTGKIKSDIHRQRLSVSNLGKNNGKYTGEKHHMTKMTDLQVIEVRRQWLTMDVTREQLCAEFNMTRAVLSGILNCRTFRHLLNEDDVYKLGRLKRWRPR